MKGYTRDVYYKLIGYPNDSKFKKKGRHMNHSGNSQGNFHTAHNAVTHSSSFIPCYLNVDTYNYFRGNRRNSKINKGEWTSRFGGKLERGECSTYTSSKEYDIALVGYEKVSLYGLGASGGFTSEQYNQIMYLIHKDAELSDSAPKVNFVVNFITALTLDHSSAE